MPQAESDELVETRCGEASKMLFKEDPFGQADVVYDAQFKGHRMMDPNYDVAGVLKNTTKMIYAYKPSKYGWEEDSEPFASGDW